MLESRTNRTLTNVVLIVAIIGALNWGLIGFFNWNLVNAIFGGNTHETASAFSRLIYAIVGLAGLATLFLSFERVGVGKLPTGRRVEV